MKTQPALPLDIKLMNLTSSALILVFGLLMLVALAAWAAQHPLFAIAGMTVRGDVSHNNAVTLRANVAARFSGTFFTLDLKRAQSVFESVPWIRRAVVQREFPNRLRVILQEHQPVGYWGLEGESRLINSHGEVFEANVGEIEQESLPRMYGPEDQAGAVLQMYQQLTPVFETVDLLIEQIDLSGRGSWRLRLDSGAVIELGRGSGEELIARLQRFLGTLTQVTGKYGRKLNALESADLRYSEGFAVRIRGISTVLPDGQKK